MRDYAHQLLCFYKHLHQIVVPSAVWTSINDHGSYNGTRVFIANATRGWILRTIRPKG